MSQLPEIFNQQIGQGADPVQLKRAIDDIRNLLNLGIESDNLRDNAVSDVKIGLRTIDDTVLMVDSGTLTVLLSALANAIKAIKGTENWKDPAVTSLQYLLTNKTDVGHTHGEPVDGHTHDEFKSLDMLGVMSRPTSNLWVSRGEDGLIQIMQYLVFGDVVESGAIEFHRNALGRLDCTRLSNSLGTQVQIELIRDGSGRVGGVFRSAFNAMLQSGLTWPID